MNLGLTPEEWQALLLSLKVAVVATLVLLPISVALAWLLERKRFPGHGLLNLLIHLPLVLPPVVTGYALLLTFGRKGWVGSWLDQVFGIVFAFRWTGAVIAAAVMALPLFVRAARIAIAAIEPEIERSALSLGATPWQTFRFVTLPLARNGLIAGMAVSFAKALGEFGATITFVANIPGETQTLASAIYTFLQVPDGDAQALRLCYIAVAVSFAALAASEYLARMRYR